MRRQTVQNFNYRPQLARRGVSIIWVRRIIFTIMIFMVLEGAFRKWIFPNQHALIYFVKDGLLLVALLLFAPYYKAQNWRIPLPPSARIPLALSLGYFLLEIANPFSPSVIVGIVGYKNYLLYISLIYIVPFIFTDEADFEDKVRIYMLLMTPVCVLGLIQFASPSGSWLNTYVKHAAEAELSIASFGGHLAITRTRATGTFSYLTGFANFVAAMYMLSLGCILGCGQSRRLARAAYVLFGASAIAVFTTGSRGAFVSTFLSTPIVLLMCLSKGVVSSQLAIRFAAGLLLVSALGLFTASDAIDAFMNRATSSDSNWDRLLSPFTEWAGAVADAPFIGIGIGSTHPSAGVIMQVRGFFDYWWLRGLLYESETARVVIETGIIGFVLNYIPRVTVVIIAFRMVRRLQSPLFKALSASIATFCLGLSFSSVISNPTAGIYFWFSAGLLFAMHRMDDYRRINDHTRVVRRYAGLRSY